MLITSTTTVIWPATLSHPSGLTKLSIDRLPPVATRGVLLDIAKLMKTDILPAGTAFNKAEIDAAAKAAGITIEAGDVVLFHTGWLNVMDSDAQWPLWQVRQDWV